MTKKEQIMEDEMKKWLTKKHEIWKGSNNEIRNQQKQMWNL